MSKYALMYSIILAASLFAIPVANAGERSNGLSADHGSYTMTGGRYFVVAGCHGNWGAAQRKARRIRSLRRVRGARLGSRVFPGAHAVNTSNYPNFSNGYKCAVVGPSSRRRANERCSIMKFDYNIPCYVKAGY